MATTEKLVYSESEVGGHDGLRGSMLTQHKNSVVSNKQTTKRSIGLDVIKQELNEASAEKIDEVVDPPTIPIDSERNAVKVSMIKRNNEIIYQ